ncbi:MAG: LacI family transcriptional regulator [Chlorobi bacterium]|nr:LacI family transcriptional regulator [Chlorobiota bacterium]
MKKTSLNDIAKALGVSKALVSLVLNNRGDEMGINKETQRKVIKMAAKLNYKPNLVARGLRLGASKNIGVIIPDISNPFFARIARTIEDEAGKLGYHVTFVSTDENPQKESRLIRLMLERQSDGLIIASSQPNTADILNLRRDNVPFVLIDRYFPQVKTNYVVVDNHKAAYNVVTHLINLGYRKIALVKISPEYLTPIRFRLAGYRDALRDHGIRYDKHIVREIPFGEGLANQMEPMMHDLLFRPLSVEAVFFLNNSLALAGLEVINRMNLRIPQDVAIVSFDDIDVFRLFHPPVTAVAQPYREMAKEAVRILVKEIQSPHKRNEKSQMVFAAKLEIRRSCGFYK